MKRWMLAILFGLMLFTFVGCGGTEERLGKELSSAPNPDTRIEAADQLGEMGTPRSLQLLELAAENEKDFRVKENIARNIKKINKQIFMH